MNAATLLLVKTAPEISLKSDYVRRQFTKRLIENIRIAAKNNGIKIDAVDILPGRLFIKSSNLKKLAKLSLNVFGVHAVALVENSSDSDLENVKEFAADFAQRNLKKEKTFAVRATRSGNQKYSSKDVGVQAGAEILKRCPGLKVNLTKPEITFFVEIRNNEVYCYVEEQRGLGGLPVGVEGNVALFCGGKEEDLVAGFLMLKRGTQIFPVFEKIKPNIKNLIKFNSCREFKLTNAKEIEKLKTQYNLQAIVLSERKLKTKESKLFDLPVLRPLVFYPEELYKEKLKYLK